MVLFLGFKMSLIQYNLLRVLFVIIIIFFLTNLNFIRYKLRERYNFFQSNQTLCNISLIESDAFLCESDEKWQKRREFYSEQHETNILTMNEYENYFSKNWLPEFQCENELRLGENDGGKWVRCT